MVKIALAHNRIALLKAKRFSRGVRAPSSAEAMHG